MAAPARRLSGEVTSNRAFPGIAAAGQLPQKLARYLIERRDAPKCTACCRRAAFSGLRITHAEASPFCGTLRCRDDPSFCEDLPRARIDWPGSDLDADGPPRIAPVIGLFYC